MQERAAVALLSAQSARPAPQDSKTSLIPEALRRLHAALCAHGKHTQRHTKIPTRARTRGRCNRALVNVTCDDVPPQPPQGAHGLCQWGYEHRARAIQSPLAAAAPRAAGRGDPPAPDNSAQGAQHGRRKRDSHAEWHVHHRRIRLLGTPRVGADTARTTQHGAEARQDTCAQKQRAAHNGNITSN